MVNLDYDLSSLCGPVDLRVVERLEQYRGNKLDPAYLEHLQQFHGGIPGKQYFTAADSNTYRVGRFLTLVDKNSPLEQPFRPSWSYPERDVRIDWSVLTLIDQEGPTCRNLFGGEKLLPFAALYWGPDHPDEMELTDGNVNLLGFFYQSSHHRPSVVIWLADQAQTEYSRWEAADKENEEVRYADFTIPVAVNFDAFLKLLRADRPKPSHPQP